MGAHEEEYDILLGYFESNPMKLRVLLALILTALFFSTVSAQGPPPEGNSLPDPPKGFTWIYFSKIEAKFLRPEGWFVKTGVQKGTVSVFITKEDIDKEGQFITGLTLNVIKDVPKKTSVTPYEYAFSLRELTRKSLKFLDEWDPPAKGDFKSLGYRYEKDDPAGAYITHNYMIANEKTGTLYWFIFEAPSVEWEETWKIAEPMLKHLVLVTHI